MIGICDYGMGNRRSVVKAFERVGADVRMTDDLDVLERADALVVPGVGAFPQAMDELRARRLDTLVRRRAADGVPVLGICLGMQLLFESSDEHAGAQGLGQALEVAERLVEADRETQVGGRSAHLGRRPRRGDEVGLEQLDLVEAGGRGGGELLLQRAAEAHRRDRPPPPGHQSRFPNWSTPTITVVAPSSRIAAPMITSR